MHDISLAVEYLYYWRSFADHRDVNFQWNLKCQQACYGYEHLKFSNQAFNNNKKSTNKDKKNREVVPRNCEFESFCWKEINTPSLYVL